MTTAASTLTPGKSPFQRAERLLIVGLVLVIAVWGFTGVDWDSLNNSVNEPPGQSPSSASGIALAMPSDGGADMGDAVTRGAAVFEANGCYACHSVDGSEKIGPSLLGVWGHEQALEGGITVVVDRDYVYESILNPQAKLVQGFTDAAMPSYQDLVTDEDLAALAAYLESLQ